MRAPVGDADYGGAPSFLSQVKRDYKTKSGQEERPLPARPALHAERLTIAQPTAGLTVAIGAPWPKDLAVAVKSVRRFAARQCFYFGEWVRGLERDVTVRLHPRRAQTLPVSDMSRTAAGSVA
jgi:hypothetical protein